jgi:aspartate carbamoyltransferase catalytic subunit
MQNESQIQLGQDGRLRHLLTLEDLNKNIIENILHTAKRFVISKKISEKEKKIFQSSTVANLFFEPSTRTRGSFEIASKLLGCNSINIDIKNSSEKKGETLLDTVKTIQSLGVNVLIVRHSASGSLNLITQEIGDKCIVINAGEGLLDLLTISQTNKSFNNLIVTIIGDISHSRVARSTIHGLTTMGVKEIRLVAPEEFSVKERITPICKNIENIDEGLLDANVVMALRIQHERIKNSKKIKALNNYFENFGLTQKRMKLASPDAIIMHPGPMNRDVEIESSLADGSQSVILQQVANGVAIRMALLMELLTQHD